MKKMDKTDAQWKSELSAMEYQILRKEGTEASFSHPHNKEYRKGIFACVACSTPLFTSDMKFDFMMKLPDLIITWVGSSIN